MSIVPDDARIQRHVVDKLDAGHPLLLIPYFRTWPKTWWREWAFTFFFNCLIASGFIITATIFIEFKSWGQFGALVKQNLIVANAIGFTWHFVMEVLGPLLKKLNRQPFWVIIATYTLSGLAITSTGIWGVSFLPGFEGMRRWIGTGQWWLSIIGLSFVISLTIGLMWRARVKELVGEAKLAEERSRTEAIHRAAMQANLRALQAQIEPHFLFNTLANVTSLIHSKPDDAKRMLEEFIAYLRASLAASRDERTTLARDFELMRAYLDVFQIRMGRRLSFEMALDPAAADYPVPPLLIQPLVENAIKHGLEPKIAGGTIRLAAQRHDDTVTVVVADTGLGFGGGTASGGIGLANVRERLEKLYDGRASLLITDNAPSGTAVTLTLPWSSPHAPAP